MCIVTHSFVLLFTCLVPASFVNFKKDIEYLWRETIQELIPLMKSRPQSLVLRSLHVLLMWLYVGVCPGQTISLSFFVRNPHKRLRTRSPARPEVEEERKVPGKTEVQLTKEPRESSRQRRAEEDGRIEIAVQGKDCQQKEAAREDSQRWVSIPCGFVEVSRKIHAHDSLQMHKKLHKIVTQTSLSCTWNWPKSKLFVCSSFYPLGCILCGCKEMWNTPAETTRWITGHE